MRCEIERVANVACARIWPVLLALVIRPLNGLGNYEAGRECLKLRIASSLWVWGGFVAVLALVDQSREHDYELRGDIEAAQYFAAGKEQALEPIRFHVYVRDCAWLIRSVPSPSGDFGKRISYWETASDGKVVYSFVALKDRDGNGINWKGAVARDPVPLGTLLPQASVVWLAVAARCYLDQAGELLVPPYSREFERVAQQAHVVRSKEPPYLPERIVFLADGYNRRSGLAKKYPAPFDAGFTNAFFSAQGFTGIGGLYLPTAFALDVYEPRNEGLAVGCRYRGTVNDARPSCTLQNFLPEIPTAGGGEIGDYRFISSDARSPHPFTYRSMRWLHEEEVRQLPGFTNYTVFERTAATVPMILREAPVAPNQASKLGRIAIIAFVGGSTLALIFLLRKTLKERKEQHK